MIMDIDKIVSSRMAGYEMYNSFCPVNMNKEERGRVMREIKIKYPDLRVGCCEFYGKGYCIFTMKIE